jgi:uncharacterized membrane protein
VQAIIDNRCIACHAAMPTQAGFASAPAGIMLDQAALIRQHKDKIYMQVVQLKAMPLANLTKMTDEERTVIASWYQAGAK